MGLGASDPCGCEETAPPSPAAAASCSICFEVVTLAGDRSTARLQCGHEFHLDCIGSAFNAKGVMQCPNCRKIEKGNWLYASGFRSLPELNVEAWPHDEDLYDFHYSEMPIGVHWCPFSRLARISASFEEGETPAFAFQDLLGHHAAFAEPAAAASSAHACPYLAYVQPLQPSSSSNPTASSENPADDPSYQHWNHVLAPTDAQNLVAPVVDLQYHSWEPRAFPHFTPSSRAGISDQASVPSATIGASRVDSDGLQRATPHAHPYFVSASSGFRAGSSLVSSLFPPYSSSSRAQTHAHEHQQHHNSPAIYGPFFPGIAGRASMRGSVPTAPPRSVPHENNPFYIVPHTGPSSRSLQETENFISGGTRFYAWERDRLAPYPLLPMDAESGWWRAVPHSTGSSDSNSRIGVWQRHGSERSSSHGRSEGSSYRPPHSTRMHQFI